MMEFHMRGCGFTANPPAIPARSTAGGRRAGPPEAGKSELLIREV